MDQKLVDEIIKYGPDRIVINSHGEAISSMRAHTVKGCAPDVIFIRGDGWSLGAAEEYIRMAESMWEDEWVGVLVKPSKIAISYNDWIALDRPTVSP